MAAEIIAAGKNESAAVQKSGLAESFGFAWAQVRQPPSTDNHCLAVTEVMPQSAPNDERLSS